ncbi:MAG: HDOD domain-containing protein [Myxococcales bacterium]|nr:HDOD domain-containing protein [Myxococcales bacterium]
MHPSLTPRQGIDTLAAFTETLLRSTQAAFASGEITVPPLNWAAAGLLTRHETPSLDWLVGAVASDDALASAVLRIANAPSYQPRWPVVSVGQAATRLGAEALAEIALAASMQTHLFAVPGFENEQRAFWRQALASAVLAKELSRSCGVAEAEGFACGLLHEVGTPIALCATATRCHDLGWAPAAPGVREVVLDVARRVAPLAAATAIDTWALTSPLAGAIRRHEGAFRVTDSAHATVAHMATRMAATLYQGDGPWRPSYPVALRASAPDRVLRQTTRDPTSDHLEGLGESVRVHVDSLTV